VSPRTAERLGLRAAPWLLWFGVLGGAVAWSLHTVADWGLDETVCRSGNDSVGPIPLRVLLFVLAVVFLAISLASLAVAYLQWRRRGAATAQDGPADDEVQALRQRRAGFMAVIGVVANVLFALMLAASAVAILILPACQGSP
jgi:CBS domain containing-hemolysin-like protein